VVGRRVVGRAVVGRARLGEVDLLERILREERGPRVAIEDRQLPRHRRGRVGRCGGHVVIVMPPRRRVDVARAVVRRP